MHPSWMLACLPSFATCGFHRVSTSHAQSATGGAARATWMTSPQIRGARSPRAPAVQARPRSRRRRDGEAEHHPALMVLGDVAVRHPPTRIRDVEQDVDGLAGANE